MSKEFNIGLIWKDVGIEYQNLSDYHFPLPTRWGRIKYRIEWLLGIYLFKKYQSKKIHKKLAQQAIDQLLKPIDNAQ